MLFAMGLMAIARQPERGYRGFVDWNNDLTWYTTYDMGSSMLKTSELYYYSGVSTSHGYQFNPHLFFGAGVGVESYVYADEYIVPVFLDVRTDQKFGGFTPFADLRIGASLTDGGGFYLSPSIGHRFNWGRRVGLNLALGFTLKTGKIDVFNITPVDNIFGSYWDMQYIGQKTRTKMMFAVRLGIDF